MKKNPVLIMGLIGIVILLFLAFVGPYLPFVDSNFQDEPQFILKEEGGIQIPPYEASSEYILGSDRQGRDLLSLLILGARPTLAFVLNVCILRYLISIPIGMFISNPIGSKFPRLIVQTWSRLASYVPAIIIIVLLAKSPLMLLSEDRTLWMLVLISLIEVGRVSEFVSNEVNKLKSEDFVTSGIMVGNGFLGLVKRYYWPHLLPQIVIHFSIDLSRTIFLIGQLGIFSIFISHIVTQNPMHGISISNTSITWPMLLQNVLFDIRQAPWIPFWASAFIAFACFTFYLVSEGLRKRLNNETIKI